MYARSVIPALLVIFAVGATGVFVLATAAGRRWLWCAALLETALLFHELSFALGPTREWIRLDLLVTMPAFSIANLLLALYAGRRAGAYAGLALAGSAVALPIWFFLLR